MTENDIKDAVIEVLTEVAPNIDAAARGGSAVRVDIFETTNPSSIIPQPHPSVCLCGYSGCEIIQSSGKRISKG